MNRQERTYANRLLKLSAFLEELPRRRFDYEHWVGEDWDGTPLNACGTTACALGWATQVPLFKQLGLRLLFAEESGRGGWVEGRDGQSDKEVAGDIFGITTEEFFYLFTPYWTVSTLDLSVGRRPTSTATPKQVAKHIRRFVKWKYGVKA